MSFQKSGPLVTHHADINWNRGEEGNSTIHTIISATNERGNEIVCTRGTTLAIMADQDQEATGGMFQKTSA